MFRRITSQNMIKHDQKFFKIQNDNPPEMVVPVDQLVRIGEVEFSPEVEEVDTSVGKAATLKFIMVIKI